jgi:hypothetical protein
VAFHDVIDEDATACIEMALASVPSQYDELTWRGPWHAAAPESPSGRALEELRAYSEPLLTCDRMRSARRPSPSTDTYLLAALLRARLHATLGEAPEACVEEALRVVRLAHDGGVTHPRSMIWNVARDGALIANACGSELASDARAQLASGLRAIADAQPSPELERVPRAVERIDYVKMRLNDLAWHQAWRGLEYHAGAIRFSAPALRTDPPMTWGSRVARPEVAEALTAASVRPIELPMRHQLALRATAALIELGDDAVAGTPAGTAFGVSMVVTSEPGVPCISAETSASPILLACRPMRRRQEPIALTVHRADNLARQHGL